MRKCFCSAHVRVFELRERLSRTSRKKNASRSCYVNEEQRAFFHAGSQCDSFLVGRAHSGHGSLDKQLLESCTGIENKVWPAVNTQRFTDGVAGDVIFWGLSWGVWKIDVESYFWPNVAVGFSASGFPKEATPQLQGRAEKKIPQHDPVYCRDHKRRVQKAPRSLCQKIPHESPLCGRAWLSVL